MKRCSVSIPLWFDCNEREEGAIAPSLMGLHPTMVRLQHMLERHWKRLSKASPSHYGSTATRLADVSPRGRAKVSIPLWFDCNTLLEPSRLPGERRLHPTMVRLQLSLLGTPLPERLGLHPTMVRLQLTWVSAERRSKKRRSPSHYGSTAT